MLRVIVLFLVMSLVCSKPLTPSEQAEKALSAYKECGKDTGLGQDSFRQQLREHKIDDNLKIYNLCLLQTTEILKNDGKLDVPLIKIYLSALFPKHAEAVLEKCTKEESGELIEIAIKFTTCGAKIIQGQ